MVEKQHFESKEISLIVDNILVYGTLTYPVGVKATCGVVFIAGSGQLIGTGARRSCQELGVEENCWPSFWRKRALL